MATVSSSPQSVDVSSKITVTMPQGSSRFTRTSNTGTGSVSCSVSVPAGSTINSATFSCTTSGGTLYGGTTKINGTTVSGQGPHYVGNGTNTQITVSFSFKSTATDGDQSTKPSTSYTQTRTFANCILTVDYTPPTAPSVWGVTLDGSAGTQYRGSNGGLTLNWSAQNGTNNNITSYSVHASDNGGAWYWWNSLSPGSAVTAHPTQGNSRKWLVTPVAPYGNGAGVESPTVYTYSYPTAPAISISPSSCYTGDPVTISFSGASGGTGVSINSYSLYPGNSDSAIVENITGSSYASTAPVEAGTYTYRMRSIGSVPGYNSGYSNTVTLVVSPRQSSFTVNNAAYPNLGQQLTATISPVNSSYTHKIKWQATNDPDNYNSGGYATISAGVTTATFTPPLSWAKAEPSSPNTIGITVLLQTWNGASKVGTEAVVSFSSNIPASVKPQNPSSSGATFAPNPALPAFGGVFLVGNSKLQSTLSYSNNSYTNATSYTFIITPPTPQTQYSSTVSTPTYTTANTLSMAGTYTISAYATDARGRSSDTVTVGSIIVYNYTQPSFNITYLSREPVTSGTQFRINATVTVDKRNPPLSANAVSATHVFRAEWREKGATTWTTANITSGTAINLGSPNIALNKAYEVRVSAGDKVYETRLQSQIYTVPPVVRQFDFRNDRASLGKIASDTAKTFTLPDDWQTIGGRYKSVVPTGTPPLEVASSTLVTNLNADLLDGNHASAFLGKTEKAADSDKLDGVHLADIRLGQNLLHNWDFYWKQINQRGVGSGRSNSWVNFIDRWTRTAGYITKDYDYIGVENGTTIRQVVESTMLAGMVVTVSIMKTDNTVIYGTGTVPSASGVTETITISGFGTVTIAWAGSHIAFNFNSTTNFNIKRVKAELGTVSTLHLDPPIDEATNWMQCLRYYQSGYVLQGSFKAMWSGAGQIVGTINLLCPMRTVPTLIIHSFADLLTCYGIATWSPTSFEYTEVYSTSFVCVRFYGNAPQGALWGSRFYTLNFELNAEI